MKLKERPVQLFLLPPQDLESALLKKEEEHHQLKEKAIIEKQLKTRFDVKRVEDKWVVKVISRVEDKKP